MGQGQRPPLGRLRVQPQGDLRGRAAPPRPGGVVARRTGPRRLVAGQPDRGRPVRLQRRAVPGRAAVVPRPAPGGAAPHPLRHPPLPTQVRPRAAGCRQAVPRPRAGRRELATPTNLDREALAGAPRSANAASATQHAQFRRFHNLLLGASIVVLSRSQARRISNHRVRHTLSHWLRSFYCRGISPTTGCGAAAPPRTAQLPEPRRRSRRPV